MTNNIYHITARHKYTDKVVDMFFPSIKQARDSNPNFENFECIGLASAEQKFARNRIAVKNALQKPDFLAIGRKRVKEKYDRKYNR